ncbi:FMN-binding protein [Oceanobacter kriegii]|uniref:FMN-binding protein n=1 Tax=Oceanobacter kriegii TaxID=64972 RepID=UPI00040BB2CE|nr:FMN-binding protein [Oceanobacter kriegii]
MKLSKYLLTASFSLLMVMGATSAKAEEYLSQADFLKQAFGEQQPKVKTLWLKKDIKPQVADILGHPYAGLRVRYWYQGNQSAWILEEIGKERPITIGVILDADQIRSVNILAFRESRGWEVKYPFFTDQFKGLTLTDDQQLSDHIDGVTGATLSVRAVTKVARLALFFAHKEGLAGASPVADNG